jgi:hypothetical protein
MKINWAEHNYKNANKIKIQKPQLDKQLSEIAGEEIYMGTGKHRKVCRVIGKMNAKVVGSDTPIDWATDGKAVKEIKKALVETRTEQQLKK